MNNVNAIDRLDILGHQFDKRRRGYDTAAVDQFLQEVAQKVERLEKELEAHTTDKTALDLLKKAERLAHDTRVGAEMEAKRELETAAKELEQARLTAAQLVEEGRADSTRIVGEAETAAKRITTDAEAAAARVVGEAEVEAARIVTQAKARAAGIVQTATRESAELQQQMQEVRTFITDSATDLRLGASRLVELADHFESNLTRRTAATRTAAETVFAQTASDEAVTAQTNGQADGSPSDGPLSGTTNLPGTTVDDSSLSDTNTSP